MDQFNNPSEDGLYLSVPNILPSPIWIDQAVSSPSKLLWWSNPLAAKRLKSRWGIEKKIFSKKSEKRVDNPLSVRYISKCA